MGDAVRRYFPRALIFTIVCLATLSGILESRNLVLMDMRFRILDRTPSDTLLIVEIDPYSLKEEGQWPWPRDRYATVIANLQDAGAALIALDIDFSSPSDEAGDAAFAASLARRPGEVILPVFSQWSSHSGSELAIMQTPPHASFLNDAVVASVNLTTEENGFVRRGWRGFDEGGSYRATLAATLAGVPANRTDAFYIDYSVDPSKIHRLSFNDVLNNSFSRDLVEGKNILIGATALELGDEFAVPTHGVISGIALHALSYETLQQDRALFRPHVVVTLMLAALVILCFGRAGGKWGWRTTTGLHLAVFTASIGGPVILQAVTPISLDTVPLLVAQILCIAHVTAHELHWRAKHLIRHRATTARYQVLTSLVVRNNSDGVIVTDANGVIELCNDRAMGLLAVKTELAPNTHIRDLAPDFPLCPSIENSVDAGACVDTTAPSSGSSEYCVGGQKDQMLEIVFGSAPYDHQHPGNDALAVKSHVYVYTIRDISIRKRIEMAEKTAKENAVAASKLKSQLISNISHELRTPLNGVMGFAEILQREALGPLGAAEYKEYSKNIYLSGERLLSIVNDMLNISKLDAGEFELDKDAMPLRDVVENVLNDYEAGGGGDGKSIRVEIPKDLPLFEIDFTIFKEMLSHLLSNAVKFTGDDAYIFIRAVFEDNDLVLEVEDNGCGVDPCMLSNLTEAFFQADSSLNRQHEGAGLGLYLVSTFAALHGGSIEFDSRKTAGFTARLRFKNIVTHDRQRAA